MNNQDFLKEVLDSGYYGPEFVKIYDEFSEYQKKIIEVFRLFNDICEKFNIPYQLAFGSLLGAVRDKGQIPWDYDIDVFVPYYEKDRLIQTLVDNGGDVFFVDFPATNLNCRRNMLRLAPLGYSSEVFHLDVFWVIGYPESKLQQAFLSNVLSLFWDVRFYKYIHIKEKSMGEMRSICAYFIHSFLHLFIPLTFSSWVIEKICSYYNIKKYVKCVHVSGACGSIIFEKRLMWETMVLNTDIGNVRISKNYNYMLNKQFGSIISIPPLHIRLKELMNNYKVLRYYRIKSRC